MNESELETPSETESPAAPPGAMARRFRGYLPVVVDVETGGFDWNRHALLEMAAVPIELDEQGLFVPGQTASAHFIPAPGTQAQRAAAPLTFIWPEPRSPAMV